MYCVYQVSEFKYIPNVVISPKYSTIAECKAFISGMTYDGTIDMSSLIIAPAK